MNTCLDLFRRFIGNKRDNPIYSMSNDRFKSTQIFFDGSLQTVVNVEKSVAYKSRPMRDSRTTMNEPKLFFSSIQYIPSSNLAVRS